MQIKEYISSTHLAKSTASTISSLESDEIDRIIVLKNNAPKAVLMSFDAYQMMEEEIEDLRLTALALSRMQTFDPDQAVSHKEMMEKYT